MGAWQAEHLVRDPEMILDQEGTRRGEYRRPDHFPALATGFILRA